MTEILAVRADKIAAASVAAERETGYPAEIIAGQCALESGWLASAPGNNAFGWKAYVGAHGRQLLQTRECFTEEQRQHFEAGGDGRGVIRVLDNPAPPGKKWYLVWDWFATFADLQASFVEHARRLQTRGKYAAAWQVYLKQKFETRESGVKWLATEIAKAGYATAPGYASTLIAVALGVRMQSALWKARTTNSKTLRKEPITQ